MDERSDGVVTLTLFTEDDAAVMCAGDCDPELRRRFEFPAGFAPSVKHSRQVVARWQAERAAGTRFPFAVRSAVTRELLGGCELRPKAGGAANVSYWTYPPHRGKGVATRALRLVCEFAIQFGFHVLDAEIDADNAASRSVAIAAGFREVGGRLYARRIVSE